MKGLAKALPQLCEERTYEQVTRLDQATVAMERNPLGRECKRIATVTERWPLGAQSAGSLPRKPMILQSLVR
jgi:hypothetical protein